MNLAAEMANLPEPPFTAKPPYWDAWRHDLWVRAQRDDAHHFMRWPCIFHTMLQDHWRDSIAVEGKYIEQRIDMGALLKDHHLPMGDLYASSSLYNLTHQAYHILRWQEATGQRIADMRSIYEFGGGYGAMALVCNRLGFTGQYYIYDLPEF